MSLQKRLQEDIKNNKSSFWSGVALAIAYDVITLLGVLIMYAHTSNSFVHHTDKTTFVEASWNKIAQDGLAGWLWIVIVLIVSGWGPLIYAFREGFGGKKEKDTSFIWVLIVLWLAGWLIIFSGTVSRYGDSQYQETIPTEQYEKLKSEGTLDSLFPG
jgi:hypothetical protein